MSETSGSRIYDIILESVGDGVFTIDKNKVITAFNRAAEQLTGIPREEALGKNCFDVFRASICQDSCALEETIATGKRNVNLVVDILNAKGEKLPVSISTAVLRDRRGRIIGGVETFRDLSAIEELRKELHRRYTFEDIISKNHEVQKIFSILPDIAESDSTVLIEGPSGSGKELFARAIHNLSRRRRKSLIVINCGAIPDTLLESELFGYVRGAFTDAKKDKPGKLALAEGGTVFLDEVSTLSPALQVKLLRFLQEREFEPLGSTTAVRADVRVVAATNVGLSREVEKGSFREDLYFRLNVIKIELPPLASRREDIPLLIEHFLNRFNVRMGKSVRGVSQEVLELLMGYEFPGNVRELENIIEHAIVLCRGARIEVEHLPRELRERFDVQSPATISLNAPGRLKGLEAQLIAETLKRLGGHRGRTAAELGIDKSTLWRKMKKYGIQ